MKVIVDTNVFVSGIFFSGPPYRILQAWQQKKLSLYISPDILNEYKRVGEKLAGKYPGVDLDPWITLMLLNASLIDAPTLDNQICEDPDDDKFIACAIAAKVKLIISGDKHLLDINGYQNITVLKPRKFIDLYLSNR